MNKKGDGYHLYLISVADYKWKRREMEASWV